MEQIRKDFAITLNKKEILEAIDCHKESPVYDEFSEEYDKIVQLAEECMRPISIMKICDVADVSEFSQIPVGSKVLYVFMTVGEGISELSTKAFQKDEYVAGMLFNSMADNYLFQMDERLQEDCIKLCKQYGFGINQRLEAPNDIPLEIHKYAAKATECNNKIGVQVLESGMLYPVKTMCILYILGKDCSEYHVSHDCSSCNNFNCKQRTVEATLTVEGSNLQKKYIFHTGQSILQILKQNQIYVPALCNGRGSCGKCKVKILSGDIKVTEEDRKHLLEYEISEGIRLSCYAYPKGDCTIQLLEDESKMSILTDVEGVETDYLPPFTGNKDIQTKLCIDIGTTTIAMKLYDKSCTKELGSYATVNSQRAYGADVISRIQASENYLEELKKCVRDDIRKGIDEFVKRGFTVSNMILAGNTTMIHLLMGYSCKTLGVYPFVPVEINEIHTNIFDIPTDILPGISAYIGADIVSGILNCKMDLDQDISLLIDLGTNGEMALGNSQRILVTSAAAGPAFEGGSISCGCASIPGAISGLTIENGKCKTIEVIGDTEPVGLCGSGVLEIISELRKEELIDETGLFSKEYVQNEFCISEKEKTPIVFTQKDIREVQLAKAAIRAGIELLVEEYGITMGEVKHVYLAGGFGFYMNIEKAIHIGIIPKALRGRIKAVGNSSLKGCVDYGSDKSIITRIAKIKSMASEITLANLKNFNDYYMNYMYFEE